MGWGEPTVNTTLEFDPSWVLTSQLTLHAIKQGLQNIQKFYAIFVTKEDD
jgi:hypothetical protein